jgi:bifunctional non-homologous end joining protein LigD
MSPIASTELPTGSDWGYQLKWDGVRTLAVLDNGQVSLYSKRLLLKNTIYPEIVEMLTKLQGRFLLDGEIIMFDTEEQKPNFQKVLQRERSGGLGRMNEQRRYHLCYVLFDLLYVENQDIRLAPYEKRHAILLKQFHTRSPQLFVTDLMTNGQALWQWVEEHGWEGVISKRLTSPYQEGKKHSDWFKKKTTVDRLVQIVGLTIRNGKVASLVMELNGDYFGRVSLGLTEAHRQKLMTYGVQHQVDHSPWGSLPDLNKETIMWFSPRIPCYVTGLEITSAGVLRHPKIVQIIW